MSLREQLRKLLPDILPADPKDAIKGTELIQLVKYRLKQDYSDATLRYHFSIMSCDPSAPIAKVEHGQGYYLRTNTLSSMASARHMLTANQATFGGDFGYDSNQALFRANKFRAIASRVYREANRFPFVLNETFGEDAEYRDLWKFPDMVIVDWEVGVPDESGLRFDRDMMSLKRSFGSQPFTLRSVKMKLDANLETVREDFYQCLSNSRWAHFGEFVIANEIADERLLEELRSLGSEFGIGITSLGLSAEAIDDLPEPGMIESFGDREMEAIQKRLTLHRIAPPRPRRELDWTQIRRLRGDNPEIEKMFHWITYSLDNAKAESYASYAAKAAVGTLPVSSNEDAFRHAERVVSKINPKN